MLLYEKEDDGGGSGGGNHDDDDDYDEEAEKETTTTVSSKTQLNIPSQVCRKKGNITTMMKMQHKTKRVSLFRVLLCAVHMPCTQNILSNKFCVMKIFSEFHKTHGLLHGACIVICAE